MGKGPEEESLRALAREAGVGEFVHFLGEVAPGALGRGDFAYYQACDVFAMPSRAEAGGKVAEAFGIAYLEAGACRKPVVGGRSGGAAEAVADGESGILVDADREGALAGALIRLLEDGELARRMGEAGRRRAEARRWEVVAGEYEQVLRETVGG